MRRNKKKERVFESMKEFEKEFFPKFTKKHSIESMDIKDLSISLADESLRKIRNRLVK